MSDKILAIIPARGGSKSIPRKNVLSLHGKPLIAWPIELAKSVEKIGRVVVTSDDDEIMSVASQCGAEVPFKRPMELSADDTPTLPVLRHCIAYLKEKEGYEPDIVLLLYATSPFLKKKRVEEALSYFNDSRCNTVVSVTKDFGNFWRVKNGSTSLFFPESRVNRQFHDPLYRENGAIYFNRTKVLMDMNKIVDERRVKLLVMEPDENIDIDEIGDLIRSQNRSIMDKD